MWGNPVPQSFLFLLLLLLSCLNPAMGQQQLMCGRASEESLRELMMDPESQNNVSDNVSMWINLLFLYCQIRKTRLVPPIAMNLLWIISSEARVRNFMLETKKEYALQSKFKHQKEQMLYCEDLRDIHCSTSPFLRGAVIDCQRHLQPGRKVFPCLTHVEMCNSLTFQQAALARGLVT